MIVMRALVLLFVGAMSTLAAGCAAEAGDDAASAEAPVVSSPPSASATVDAAFAALRAQRTTAPLEKYYRDGLRIEACWANPAGKELSEIKKAFYCSMPLELRICNTVVLLTTDAAKREERYRGYLDCQRKVDALFGDRGRFVYGDAINKTYEDLFLRGESGLSAEDEARLVAANRPVNSGRSFPVLLAETIKGLAAEARDLASGDFDKHVEDVVSGKSTPE